MDMQDFSSKFNIFFILQVLNLFELNKKQNEGGQMFSYLQIYKFSQVNPNLVNNYPSCLRVFGD